MSNQPPTQDANSGAPRYRKKPVVIEAMQLGEVPTIVICRWLQDHGTNYTTETHRTDWHQDVLHIITLEGLMRAEPGDFIIRGVKGEFYPCKPDIFEATYERVEATQIDGSGAPYEQCVTDSEGRCIRWSHTHNDGSGSGSVSGRTE